VSDISLTENAAKRVAWIAERQSKPAILRLAVDGGGCAGFTYKFELADQAENDVQGAQPERPVGLRLWIEL
jgi:iron-sulfur cluster insertion protein